MMDDYYSKLNEMKSKAKAEIDNLGKGLEKPKYDVSKLEKKPVVKVAVKIGGKK